MRRARHAALDAVRRLIEMAELGDTHRRDDRSVQPLSSGADHRFVTVAANALIERAFRNPREYDPAKNAPQQRKFNPRLYTREELDRIEPVLRLMVRVNDGAQP